MAVFGGLTANVREFPLKGVWQQESRAYQDPIMLMTALDRRARGSASFIGEMKKFLVKAFDQLEILITEIALRVH